MSIQIIATAATTLNALYDEHGVDIWWIDTDSSEGEHIEWHKAENPTIEGREIDEETGEVLQEGWWSLDEAEDMIAAAGYRRAGTWETADDTGQPTVEIEKA